MKLRIDLKFCAFISVIVFTFYAHTLSYSAKHFPDASIIFNETILPVPLSFAQLIEYIKHFGLNHHFEASNPFYSTISNIRGTPFHTFFTLNFFLLFKKSAFNYLFFLLVLHIVNSCLCFLILNKIALSYNLSRSSRLTSVILLTLFWALNPLNVESMMFISNFGALITYFFCLVFFLFYIHKGTKKITLFQFIFLFLLYLFPLFLNEYSVTLPIILFVYLFATSLFYNAKETFKDSILKIFKQTLPLFLALFVFVIYFLSIRSSINVQGSFQDTLERVLWLSPQIFVHFLKLTFFPFYLTIDQSSLVKLGKSLFDGYSILCFLSTFILILFTFLSLFFIRRKLAFYFFLPFTIFFLALVPFLHIFSPTYNLASERYLYFPILMLVIGTSHVVFYALAKLHSKKEDKSMIPILVIILPLVVITSGRAFIRTYDWKDSRSLFASSLNEAPNGLLEGLRLSTLGNLYIAMKDDSSKIKGNKYIQEAIDILESSLTELEKAKNEHQGKLPKVVKKYGLDPKTIQAKVAYLLALTKYDLRVDANGALESLKPYMEDLSIVDTQILDLYLGLLFATDNLDEAENILNKVSKEKYSPVVLTILSELHRVKYNNCAQAENYLTKSFKQFPYDVQTLSALRNLYVKTNQAEKFAYFSYLHGIRTHSIGSLQEAYTIFTRLNNLEMADTVLKNAKLLVG